MSQDPQPDREAGDPADAIAQVGRDYLTGSRGARLAQIVPAVLRRPALPGGWLLLLGLAAPRRWSGRLLRRLSHAIYVPGISPRWRFRAGRRVPEPGADIVAVVISTGEKTRDACIAAIRAQSLRPRRLDMVENVAPISAAYNRALEFADGEFYCYVDADIVLDRHCFRTLVRMLWEDPHAAEAMALLRDELLGDIGYVRMYRTKMIEGLQYEDVVGCDRVFERQIAERGYARPLLREALGEHVAVQEPGRTFSSFMRRGSKTASIWPHKAPSRALRLARAYVERRDEAAFTALIAFCHGLFVEQKGERDFRQDEEGEAQKALELLDRFKPPE